MMLRLSSLALGLAVVLSASNAWAQEWLSDREEDEGPGIRLGQKLVFHPGLGLEGGYDTNIFHSHNNEPGAGRLRVSAHLDLATRPPQRREGSQGRVKRGSVEFRLGVAAAYNEYFSGLDVVRGHRNVDVDAGFDLNILPDRPFSLRISDDFVRSIDPQNEVGPRNYNRDRNDARIYFQYAPGGGMFDLRVGYSFQLNFFEDSETPALQYLGNYLAHEAFASVRWRFLPKTALIFNGSFTPIMHTGEGAPPGTTREVHDSYNVRATVGLVGLLTRRFSMLLQAGYGGGFYLGGGPYYDNFVGRLDFRFHITPTARISVGYNRDFFDGVFSDFYSRDRVKAVYSHLIAGRVLLELRVGFSYINYSSEDNVGGSVTTDRRDPVIDATLFAEYRIRDWIAINATASYMGNFTGFAATVGPFTDPGDFHRVLVLAGVRAMY